MPAPNPVTSGINSTDFLSNIINHKLWYDFVNDLHQMFGSSEPETLSLEHHSCNYLILIRRKSYGFYMLIHLTSRFSHDRNDTINPEIYDNFIMLFHVLSIFYNCSIGI